MLLPMQSRLASSIPRAQCAISSLNRGTRSYATNLAQNSSSTSRKSDSISQGHVTDPRNDHPQDVQSEYVRDAKATRANANKHSVDAASPNIKPDPKDKTEGNPEGMGMLDQVGSATGTAKSFAEAGNKERNNM